MKKSHCSLLLACFLALSITAAAAPADGNEPVAQSQPNSSEIRWLPKVEYSSITLTVSLPDGEVYRKEFAAGATISFSLFNEFGQLRSDGSYVYELRVTPVIDSATKGMLAASRETGDSKAVAREMQSKGFVPKEDLVQSGAFSIIGGAIVMGGGSEGAGGGGKFGSGDLVGKRRSLRNKPQAQTIAGHRLMPVSMGTANYRYVNAYNAAAAMMFAQVFVEDVIVDGSLCVGLDCNTSGENFGFDTIRLKENNLRIKFEDTSTGSFPSVDWQLTANDSANGGANRFSIEDTNNAKTPFTVEANTPNNTLYVDNTGRIGNKTATPVLDFHTVNSNTPALRLEQSNAGGFNPQTWDIAGNETNFFIRDVTNGSKLPFKIIPGAPDNSLYIKGNGAVGLGTNNPNARLDVAGNVIVQGNIDIYSNPFSLAPTREVNAKSVLDRLALVTVSSSEEGRVTHFRPNFNELEAAFGAGSDGRVSLLDIDGINMAAIKAMQEIITEKDAQITQLQTQLADIEQRLKALETGAKK